MYDVAVVGAGPTGLTLANLLGRMDLDAVLIERNPGTSDIPKAIVLDDEGARTMDAIGLADEILSQSVTATGAKYFDADGGLIAEVGAGPVEFGFPKRNYFHQPELEAILLNGVKRFGNVDRQFAVEMIDFDETEEAIILTLRGPENGNRRQIQAKYLVACDGARSRVRDALGIAFDGETYAQDWAVLDTENDPMDGAFSRFICDPARPVAIIPAPRGGRRYEFMIMPNDDRDAMLQPEILRRLLAPYRPYHASEMTRAAIYTFHARIAARWREGHVFLAGDAAHITPPFAGQGMNAGLRDVHNLAWKLNAVLRGQADTSILASYEQERRDPCWQMILLAVAMGDVVMASRPEDVAARDSLSRIMKRFPAVTDYLLAMKFKPRPRYAEGLFIEVDPVPLVGSLVGEMLPNPSLSDAASEARRLDDLLGNGFALIAQQPSTWAWLRGSADELWTRLGSSRVDLSGAGLFTDPTAAAPLRTHRDQVLLVRPDRYVAGAFTPAQAVEFTRLYKAKLSGKPVPK